MFVERLDHVNIITPRIEETLEFYERILHLRAGPSPIGPHGAFLHDASGAACIHLVGLTPENLDLLLTTNLAHRSRAETDPAGNFACLAGASPVDHVALNCRGLQATLQRFQDEGVPHRYFYIEMARLHQIFVRDPNGVILELRFTEIVPPAVVSRLNRGAISPAAGA